MQRNGVAAWRIAMWGTIAFLLVLPAIAMCFTREVNWDAIDFLAAAVLLVGGGLAYEFASRTIRDRRWRMVAAGALLLLVALIWAQGAVGIFD